MTKHLALTRESPTLPDANERRMQQAWDVFQHLQERDAHLAAELSYSVLTIAEQFAGLPLPRRCERKAKKA